MKKKKTVILTLTEACNLSCSYCYQHYKTSKRMSVDTAINAIEKHANLAYGYDQLEIDLFGGEPFLEFETIKAICNWANNHKFSIPVVFFIDTNGTLVHNDIQDWLLCNKHIQVGLSLDGTPATHNSNRSNSYDLIDIDFFANNYPAQPVRATIYQNSLSSLSDDIIHLHELGFKVTASLALGINWSIDQVKIKFMSELKTLIDYYINNPHIDPCSLFKTSYLRLYKDKKMTKWCGVFTDMVAINVDGAEYPCQSFQSNTTGNSQNFALPDFSKIVDWSDPDCADCLIANICPSCYGMNHLHTGNLTTRDKSMCDIRKIIALANTNFTARILENGRLSLSDSELALTVQAIKDIQKNYNEI